MPPFSGAYVNYVQRVPLGTVGLVSPLIDSCTADSAFDRTLDAHPRSRRGTTRC